MKLYLHCHTGEVLGNVKHCYRASVGTSEEWNKTTGLLLTRHDVVQGRFGSYSDMVYALPLHIDDSGQITFDGEKVNPTYKLGPDVNCWNKFEALKDWVKNYMGCRKGYVVYRYLTY